MSAAEKLEALDEARRHTRRAGELGTEPADAEQRALDALPEIIAVVKAAESPYLFDYDTGGEQGQERLVAALAALNAKL